MTKTSVFLYGKNSVFERIKSNPASIRKIFVQDNFDVPLIENAIKSAGILFRRVSQQELSKIKRAGNIQGIVAEVNPFEYTPFEELISRPKNRPSFIFLDRVYDPQNLGAIIRTAACFGGFAVVIPKYNACEVTETVLHVASGGENFVPVSLVSNLSNALREAKNCGYWIAGAIVEGGDDITTTKFPFPLGIVLGSEGEGIRYGVQKHLDLKVYIPMGGIPLSLNVTMACAIFCYEISKQKLCIGRNR